MSGQQRTGAVQGEQGTADVEAQGDQGQRQPVAGARERLVRGSQTVVVHRERGPSVAQLCLPQQIGGDLRQLAGGACQPHRERSARGRNGSTNPQSRYM